MHFELKDNKLNGHFRMSAGFIKPANPLRVGCYTFIWNKANKKQWGIDLVPHTIAANTIFSLSPGQALHIPEKTNDYVVLQFNREFYCVQDHDREVSCNGILFNGALSTPFLGLDLEEQRSFGVLLEVLKEEFAHQDEVQLEMLRTVLKRFIIKCTRLAKLQWLIE
jgi:hypothetical protein